jgi:hypothetical protein
MTRTKMTMIGMCAAVLLAISATATTFAAGTTFGPMDWAAINFGGYGYGAQLPDTGSGTGDGGSSMGWMIVGIAALAALLIASASGMLFWRRR